ncbi:MAG: hypothetical protein K2J13_03750, partial [Clostridia bacterium]|nr:hypothetical protein [Clostridia bacterium]
SIESTNALPKSMYTLDKVYGYYHSGTDYYFLVDATFTIVGTSPVQQNGYYVKASDTNTLAGFTKDDIADNAGYTAEISVSEPSTGDGDDTSTISPGGDPSTAPATNNFERYVLIAVIAVLCVVIIILIFAPNKSKRRPQ